MKGTRKRKNHCEICGTPLHHTTKTSRCNKHKYTNNLDPKIRIPIQTLKENNLI